MKRDLKSDIADARSESRVGISDLKIDLKADIDRIDARLMTLEAPTYEISSRLPPAPASTSPHSK